MTVLPREEEADVDLLMPINTLRKIAKIMEPGSFHCCPVSGKEATGTN